MPLLGHLPELLGVLLIGLLVFGPKRMIDMGASVGKAVREMRDSLKDIPGLGGMDMRSLLTPDESARPPLASAAPKPAPAPAPVVQVTEPAAVSAGSVVAPTPATPGAPAQPLAASSSVVEGTVERVVELRED